VYGRARAAQHAVKLRLCQYSQSVMNELVSAERLEYHAITKGALYLYRDPAELEAGRRRWRSSPSTAEAGDPRRGEVAKLDPVFEPVRGKIAGAIRDLGTRAATAPLRRESWARLP